MTKKAETDAKRYTASHISFSFNTSLTQICISCVLTVLHVLFFGGLAFCCNADDGCREKGVRGKVLYIQSTPNIDLILWHTQLIMYAVK